MTPERIAELREMLARAPATIEREFVETGSLQAGNCDALPICEDFYEAARSALPEALDEIERLRLIEQGVAEMNIYDRYSVLGPGAYAASIKENRRLNDENARLRAALVEALDGWARWASEEHQSTPEVDRRSIARLRAILRAIAGGG